MCSRYEPRTWGLITEQVKCCLVLEFHLVLFIFWHKSNVQVVRGINTEKNRSKDFQCPTEAAFAMN